MAESQHFKNEELACHCCGRNESTQALVDLLEQIRVLVNQPIRVESAYRCEAHNAKVGGVPGSEHTHGIAADISVRGMTAADLYRIVRTIPEIGGIGRADNQGYVHVDLRRIPAKWCYNSEGRNIPWTEPPISA
jgi:uncharacterized protein YcbK (DUF882 family)